MAHRVTTRFEARDTARATLLLASSGAFFPWARSGMETSLFAFLLLLALLLALDLEERPGPGAALRLGLVLGLAALARPEGMLVAGVLGVRLAALGSRGRTLPGLALGLALLVLPHLAWRLTYYGYPFPNTAYAKVGVSAKQVLRGLRYGLSFTVAAAPMLLAAGLAARRAAAGGLGSALALLVVYSAYLVGVGGDHMPAFRFFAPLLAPLALVAAAGIGTLPGGPAAGLALGLAVAHNLLQVEFHDHLRASIARDTVVRDGREVGLFLRGYARPGAVLATNTAGTLPYYSGLITIDMLGLCDAQIAHHGKPVGKGMAGHDKADGAYVLSRRPDFIHFASSLGGAEPQFPSDTDLWLRPEFMKGYELREHRLPSGRVLRIFERRGS